MPLAPIHLSFPTLPPLLTLGAAALFLLFSPAQATESPDESAASRHGRVTATEATVKAIFQSFQEHRKLPGIVWGVVLDGELLYSGGLGYANLEKQIAASSTSRFRIASMTKSFTALAILQLRDAGKLRLDDLASTYVPELENLAYLTKDAPPITLRHLLTHAGGFPEDNPWGDRQLADTDDELRQLLEDGPPFSTAPGTAYEYSNLGYAILGQIVQAVSGMEYRLYMQQHVFDPLGMDHTYWDYREVPEATLALGYGWIDDAHQPIPLEPHGSFGSMGGLITTIEDFSKYAALHLNAWPPRNAEDTGPLRRSSLREMHQPGTISSVVPNYPFPGEQTKAVVNGYAFGLRWMRDEDGILSVGHTGGLPGFGSNWMMLPDYGLAVMSFDNLTYAATHSINFEVLHTIIEEANLKPRTLPVSDILQQRKEDLLLYLPAFENAEASDVFADNFFLDQRLSDLQKHALERYAEAGVIRKIGPLTPLNQLRGSFLLHGEHKDIEVFFSLSPEPQPRIQKLIMRSRPRNQGE